jgi:hypothetical protein
MLKKGVLGQVKIADSLGECSPPLTALKPEPLPCAVKRQDVATSVRQEAAYPDRPYLDVVEVRKVILPVDQLVSRTRFRSARCNWGIERVSVLS